MSTTPKSSNKKKDIIDASFRVLMKNGLPSLSFDMIAEECGVSRQVVRYHYKDSDTLMVTLLDQLAAAYRDTMIASVMQAEGSDRVNLFLDFYFDLVEGMPKPRDDQAYDALMSLSTRSPKIRETMRMQYSLLGQVLSHEFELEHPSLGAQKANELSFLFVNIMYGYWKMVATLGLHEDHKYIARTAMERLIDSYVHDRVEMAEPVQVWSLNPEN